MSSVQISSAYYLPYLFMFSLMIFIRKSIATDTLTQSQSISDGQTLISSNQMFELGFFHRGNSSRKYIGIWYQNVFMKKCVWVANRKNPLNSTDFATSLRIGGDGNLILLDGMKKIIWSTNISPHRNPTIAVLTDKGDLSLYDSVSGSPLWDSFNYPSDTFLPGMSSGTSNKREQFLLSWKAEDDPSPGIFLGGLTTERPPQVFVWRSSKPYWRSGPWDGWRFVGVPNMGGGYANGLMLTEDNQLGSVNLSYNSPRSSRATVLFLTPDGILKMMHWDIQKGAQDGSTWKSILVPCDVYGSCGPFGVCDRNGTRKCDCLRGFSPKSSEEWAKGNWSSGCARRTELLCEKNGSTLTSNKKEKNDGFLKLGSMKLPDHHLYNFSVNSSNLCQKWCLSNCSCKAYAYQTGLGCLVWDADLIDIQKFSSTGADLFLRLAYSELGHGKESMKVIILTTVSGIVLLGVCLFAFCWWRRKRRVARKNQKEEFDSAALKRPATGSQLLWGHNSATETKSSDLPMFDFKVLAAATSNFGEENKLGGGGFGPVYKGNLEDGLEIAVKRLASDSGQGAVEFKNEILLISKLQHRNLVRLLGYCIKGDEMLLIYEFLRNKSLDTFLFDTKNREVLDWDKRLNIIQGIARGLLYLHRDSHLRIIHRDLKASNILLDDNLNPKISDFGLARAFQVTQELANTHRVVGTFGYMSPEYAMGGLFSEKSDVFSFGILILEIISGRRNTSFYHEKYNLIGCAWELWKEGKGLELIDPILSVSCSEAEFLKCMHIAILCIQDQTIDRPTMSSVVLMLTSETNLPKPKDPTFYQSLLKSGFYPETSNSTFSYNDATISQVEGR